MCECAQNLVLIGRRGSGTFREPGAVASARDRTRRLPITGPARWPSANGHLLLALAVANTNSTTTTYAQAGQTEVWTRHRVTPINTNGSGNLLPRR